MSADYCGVVEHDNDCLCDVVIPHPTGWVDCAVQDMWMGEEIVSFRGYTIEWTDHSIIEYMNDLVYAKDNWDRNHLEQPEYMGNSKHPIVRREIRRRLQSGERIMDVIEDMGLDHDDVMKALFTGKRDMDYSKLVEFEEDVLQRKFTNPGALGRKYGMNHKSSKKFHSYWGVPFGVTIEEKRDPMGVMIDELIKTRPDLSNKQISKMVAEHFGLTERPSTDKIRMRRHYLSRCNRL